MSLKEKLNSAMMGFIMSLSKADQDILRSHLNGLEDVKDAGVIQPNYSRHSLLRGVQLGKIDEQTLRHHYSILEKADEFWRTKYKKEFNKKLNKLGDEEDKYPIEFIVSNLPILLNEFVNNDIYRPIVINRNNNPGIKLEDLSDQIYVKVLGDKERLLEFYIDMYDNISIHNTLKNDYKTLSEVIDISSILIDEKVSFRTIMHGYRVKRFDKMVEHNGCFIIKLICEEVAKEEITSKELL